MTVDDRQKRRVADLARGGERILIDGDDTGAWSLSEHGRFVRTFTKFAAAIDGARRVAGPRDETIEVWRGGEYICSLPRQDRLAPDAPTRFAGSFSGTDVLAAAERHANRAARWLMTAGGVFFWIALMIVALAASLGWRLVLF